MLCNYRLLGAQPAHGAGDEMSTYLRGTDGINLHRSEIQMKTGERMVHKQPF